MTFEQLILSYCAKHDCQIRESPNAVYIVYADRKRKEKAFRGIRKWDLLMEYIAKDIAR